MGVRAAAEAVSASGVVTAAVMMAAPATSAIAALAGRRVSVASIILTALLR